MSLMWIIYLINLLSIIGNFVLFSFFIIFPLFLFAVGNFEKRKNEFKEEALNKEREKYQIISIEDSLKKAEEIVLDWEKNQKRFLKKTFIILIIFLGIIIFLPNKNTMYLMLGGYLTENILENTSNDLMYNKAIKIINLKLNELEKEIAEEK